MSEISDYVLEARFYEFPKYEVIPAKGLRRNRYFERDPLSVERISLDEKTNKIMIGTGDHPHGFRKRIKPPTLIKKEKLNETLMNIPYSLYPCQDYVQVDVNFYNFNIRVGSFLQDDDHVKRIHEIGYDFKYHEDIVNMIKNTPDSKWVNKTLVHKIYNSFNASDVYNQISDEERNGAILTKDNVLKYELKGPNISFWLELELKDRKAVEKEGEQEKLREERLNKQPRKKV